MKHLYWYLLSIVCTGIYYLIPVASIGIYFSPIVAGTDAVTWFVENMEGIETMQKAQNVGQRLMGLGIIMEIEGKNCIAVHVGKGTYRCLTVVVICII